MQFASRFISFGVIATMALMTLPLMAAEAVPTLFGTHGNVTAIELHDIDHNGQMDRARLTIDNSAHRSWHAEDVSGLKLTRNGADITLVNAYISSPPGAHPAMLEVLLDENDTDLPKTTSVGGFELSYATQGLGAGIDDGQAELAPITEGDTGANDTEIDMASPILLASSPVAGEFRVLRNRDIVLTFSEAVTPESLTYASANNPGSWSVSWSSDASIATLTHGLYRVVLESFEVTGATDLAGNTLEAGTYPNPFTFETTSVNDTQTPDYPNPVLTLTRPSQLDVLEIGMPNLINWYTNEADAASVRLSYSKDGGTSYTELSTLPASHGAYTWYAPNLPGSLILKAESLTASGLVLNIITVNPLSLALPSFVPAAFNVIGPAVSNLTDTSATVAMTLDRPVASADLSCGASILVSASVPMSAPAALTVNLTGLTTGATYTCQFDLIDLTGRVSHITVPAFLASGAGDVAAPSIVGIPKLDMFDANANSARLSWTTDEPSMGYIAYGPYLYYGNSVESTTLKTSHEVTLTGLNPGELHQARITMLDAEENAAVTDDIWFVFLRDGDLVKSKDASAVYLYKDGKRNVFPNSTIYRSWYGDDFSAVLTIPKTQLGTISLGSNVKVKANSFLVKITSDPKTYAVEPDGTLRWIQTEADARALYGDAWNTRIRDIDVSLFVDYTIGNPLASGEAPKGYMTQ